MTPIEKAAHEAALAVADIIEQARSVAYGGEASKDKIQQGADALTPIISHHLAPIQAELDELAKIRSVIKDPAAVWINMLRGEIARPQALDHYEECKMRVETLEAELDRLKRENQKAREIIAALSWEDYRSLHGGTCTCCHCKAHNWLERNP